MEFECTFQLGEFNVRARAKFPSSERNGVVVVVVCFVASAVDAVCVCVPRKTNRRIGLLLLLLLSAHLFQCANNNAKRSSAGGGNSSRLCAMPRAGCSLESRPCDELSSREQHSHVKHTQRPLGNLFRLGMVVSAFPSIWAQQIMEQQRRRRRRRNKQQLPSVEATATIELFSLSL